MIVTGEKLQQALEQARRNVESNEWPERDPSSLFPWDAPEEQPHPEGEPTE